MPKKKATPKSEPVKSEKDTTLFDLMANDINAAKSNTDVWRDNHDKWYRLRFRVKKSKTFPFAGCSNLRLPTIETYIRKAKASLIGIYANIKPRMQVVPQNQQALNKANKIEKFLDYLADYKIMLLEKLILTCDRMLEKGIGLVKICWKMESRSYTEEINLKDLGQTLGINDPSILLDPSVPTDMLVQGMVQMLNIDTSETVAEDNMAEVEKALAELRGGKEQVILNLQDELYNAPDVYPCDASTVYTPPDAGMNVQDLRWICHEYYEPLEMLVEKASNDIIDKEAVDYIKDAKDRLKTNTTTTRDRSYLLDATKDEREGIDRINNPSHLVKIWEHYAYYNPKEGEPEQKWQFIFAPEFQLTLKKQVLPYDHQKWPFVRFATEITDDRWFSPRGYAQHLEDLSKEIDAQHNQKLDNQTIRNAPMFKFRSGIVNPKLVRFIPGQGIPVAGMNPLDDSIKLMDNTNANSEFSYEREEMILKTTIQEYLGQVDYSLQSMINKRQPRTLGEVQMQAQNANQVFSLDSTMWTNSISEVFTQILELCQQYMPERVFAMVVGQDDLEPLHLTRDEIQGKYHIVCRGNDMNTNPMVKAQKSQMRVQLLINEILLQLGVVNPANAYNILKRYLQDDGEIAWKEMISMPKPQKPQPPPAGTIIKPNYDELTDAEQAQVLASIGVRPDAQGRMLYQEEELKAGKREDEMNRHQKGLDIAKSVMEMEIAKRKAKKETSSAAR